MTISKTTYEDILQLELLINSAYRGESSKKGWTTEADLLGGIRTNADVLGEILSRKDAVILKFSGKDNIISGCVYLEKKRRKMYLGMLTVSPTLQARGIGKKLLFAAEEYAHKHNCTAMQMTVISIRQELISWYQRHGYYKTGKTKPFPNDETFGIQKQPLQFIVMEKKI